MLRWTYIYIQFNFVGFAPCPALLAVHALAGPIPAHDTIGVRG